ncbi:cupin 2 domain-containing protein (plasmid) [Rhizobium phaseoli]|uniref:cupin n=2 Tax=Rhizobium phaseoli TaxID=396 RepID=UPI0007F081ED|nr:cupin [Rhizobium phaseoli]ANL69337.1 cupin 2 domain-containing protein [Rhizobium phaseoli]ANL82136.1 cupin 2 domain-containing protein [Rhizobium phaseoli]
MHVETIIFEPSDWVPNNQRLPVLLYKGLLDDDRRCDFEGRFAEGGWTDIWANGVFDYQHYHAGAHEVLGVARGSATLLIGGSGGQAIEVTAGDCLVLPAGTGHQNLGCTPDFQVVGAYPKGQQADIQTSAASNEMLAKIASVPIPHSDPVQGPSGFLTKTWREPPTSGRHTTARQALHSFHPRRP